MTCVVFNNAKEDVYRTQLATHAGLLAQIDQELDRAVDHSVACSIDTPDSLRRQFEELGINCAYTVARAAGNHVFSKVCLKSLRVQEKMQQRIQQGSTILLVSPSAYELGLVAANPGCSFHVVASDHAYDAQRRAQWPTWAKQAYLLSAVGGFTLAAQRRNVRFYKGSLSDYVDLLTRLALIQNTAICRPDSALMVHVEYYVQHDRATLDKLFSMNPSMFIMTVYDVHPALQAICGRILALGRKSGTAALLHDLSIFDAKTHNLLTVTRSLDRKLKGFVEATAKYTGYDYMNIMDALMMPTDTGDVGEKTYTCSLLNAYILTLAVRPEPDEFCPQQRVWANVANYVRSTLSVVGCTRLAILEGVTRRECLSDMLPVGAYVDVCPPRLVHHLLLPAHCYIPTELVHTLGRMVTAIPKSATDVVDKYKYVAGLVATRVSVASTFRMQTQDYELTSAQASHLTCYLLLQHMGMMRAVGDISLTSNGKWRDYRYRWQRFKASFVNWASIGFYGQNHYDWMLEAGRTTHDARLDNYFADERPVVLRTNVEPSRRTFWLRYSMGQSLTFALPRIYVVNNTSWQTLIFTGNLTPVIDDPTCCYKSIGLAHSVDNNKAIIHALMSGYAVVTQVPTAVVKEGSVAPSVAMICLPPSASRLRYVDVAFVEATHVSVAKRVEVCKLGNSDCYEHHAYPPYRTYGPLDAPQPLLPFTRTHEYGVFKNALDFARFADMVPTNDLVIVGCSPGHWITPYLDAHPGKTITGYDWLNDCACQHPRFRFVKSFFNVREIEGFDSIRGVGMPIFDEVLAQDPNEGAQPVMPVRAIWFDAYDYACETGTDDMWDTYLWATTYGFIVSAKLCSPLDRNKVPQDVWCSDEYTMHFSATSESRVVMCSDETRDLLRLEVLQLRDSATLHLCADLAQQPGRHSMMDTVWHPDRPPTSAFDLILALESLQLRMDNGFMTAGHMLDHLMVLGYNAPVVMTAIFGDYAIHDAWSIPAVGRAIRRFVDTIDVDPFIKAICRVFAEEGADIDDTIDYHRLVPGLMRHVDREEVEGMILAYRNYYVNKPGHGRSVLARGIHLIEFVLAHNQTEAGPAPDFVEPTYFADDDNYLLHPSYLYCLKSHVQMNAMYIATVCPGCGGEDGAHIKGGCLQDVICSNIHYTKGQLREAEWVDRLVAEVDRERYLNLDPSLTGKRLRYESLLGCSCVACTDLACHYDVLTMMTLAGHEQIHQDAKLEDVITITACGLLTLRREGVETGVCFMPADVANVELKRNCAMKGWARVALDVRPDELKTFTAQELQTFHQPLPRVTFADDSTWLGDDSPIADSIVLVVRTAPTWEYDYTKLLFMPFEMDPMLFSAEKIQLGDINAADVVVYCNYSVDGVVGCEFFPAPTHDDSTHGWKDVYLRVDFAHEEVRLDPVQKPVEVLAEAPEVPAELEVAAPKSVADYVARGWVGAGCKVQPLKQSPGGVFNLPLAFTKRIKSLAVSRWEEFVRSATSKQQAIFNSAMLGLLQECDATTIDLDRLTGLGGVAGCGKSHGLFEYLKINKMVESTVIVTAKAEAKRLAKDKWIAKTYEVAIMAIDKLASAGKLKFVVLDEVYTIDPWAMAQMMARAGDAEFICLGDWRQMCTFDQDSKNMEVFHANLRARFVYYNWTSFSTPPNVLEVLRKLAPDHFSEMTTLARDPAILEVKAYSSQESMLKDFEAEPKDCFKIHATVLKGKTDESTTATYQGARSKNVAILVTAGWMGLMKCNVGLNGSALYVMLTRLRAGRDTRCTFYRTVSEVDPLFGLCDPDKYLMTQVNGKVVDAEYLDDGVRVRQHVDGKLVTGKYQCLVPRDTPVGQVVITEEVPKLESQPGPRLPGVDFDTVNALFNAAEKPSLTTTQQAAMAQVGVKRMLKRGVGVEARFTIKPAAFDQAAAKPGSHGFRFSAGGKTTIQTAKNVYFDVGTVLNRAAEVNPINDLPKAKVQAFTKKMIKRLHLPKATKKAIRGMRGLAEMCITEMHAAQAVGGDPTKDFEALTEEEIERLDSTFDSEGFQSAFRRCLGITKNQVKVGQDKEAYESVLKYGQPVFNVDSRRAKLAWIYAIMARVEEKVYQAVYAGFSHRSGAMSGRRTIDTLKLYQGYHKLVNFFLAIDITAQDSQVNIVSDQLQDSLLSALGLDFLLVFRDIRRQDYFMKVHSMMWRYSVQCLWQRASGVERTLMDNSTEIWLLLILINILDIEAMVKAGIHTIRDAIETGQAIFRIKPIVRASVGTGDDGLAALYRRINAKLYTAFFAPWRQLKLQCGSTDEPAAFCHYIVSKQGVTLNIHRHFIKARGKNYPAVAPEMMIKEVKAYQRSVDNNLAMMEEDLALTIAHTARAEQLAVEVVSAMYDFLRAFVAASAKFAIEQMRGTYVPTLADVPQHGEYEEVRTPSSWVAAV